MPVSVVIPEELTRYADGRSSIQVEAGTTGQALEAVFAEYPELRPRLVSERGEFYPYLPAFLNDRKLPKRGSFRTPMSQNDQLTFVVIASGG